MMQYFFFHKQNNIFHDRVIYIVLDKKVLQLKLFPPFPPQKQWHLLTNKITEGT